MVATLPIAAKMVVMDIGNQFNASTGEDTMKKATTLSKMNFRIGSQGTKTYTGPEFYQCAGSTVPVIHCYKFSANYFDCKAPTMKDIRVWFVFSGFDSDASSKMRMSYFEAISEWVSRNQSAKKRAKIRSFIFKDAKVKVYYTRKSAVDAFATLVNDRRAENEEARNDHRKALETGDVSGLLNFS